MLHDNKHLLENNDDSGSNDSIAFLRAFNLKYGSNSRNSGKKTTTAMTMLHSAPTEERLKAFCASNPSMKPVWSFLCDIIKQKQQQHVHSHKAIAKDDAYDKDSPKRDDWEEEEADTEPLEPPKEKRTKSRKAHCRELRSSIEILEQKIQDISKGLNEKSRGKIDEEVKREAGLTSVLAWGGYARALEQRGQTLTLMKDNFLHLNAAQESMFNPELLERAKKTMYETLLGSELADSSDDKTLIVWKMRARRACSERFKQTMIGKDESKDLLEACGCNANINKFIGSLKKETAPDATRFNPEAARDELFKRLGFTRTQGLSYKSEIQKVLAERLEKDRRTNENIRLAASSGSGEILDPALSEYRKVLSSLNVCKRYAAALDSKVKALSPYVALYEKAGSVRMALKELNESRAALVKGLAQIVSDELGRLLAVKKSIIKMENKTLIPKIQAAIGNIEAFSKLGAPSFVMASLEATNWLGWVRKNENTRIHTKSLFRPNQPNISAWDSRLVRSEHRKVLSIVISDESLRTLVATAKEAIACCEKHDKEVVRGKWCAILELLIKEILENGEGKLYKKATQLLNDWQTSPGAFCLSWVTVDGLTFSQWLSSWKEKCLQRKRKLY